MADLPFPVHEIDERARYLLGDCVVYGKYRTAHFCPLAEGMIETVLDWHVAYVPNDLLLDTKYIQEWVCRVCDRYPELLIEEQVALLIEILAHPDLGMGEWFVGVLSHAPWEGSVRIGIEGSRFVGPDKTHRRLDRIIDAFYRGEDPRDVR